MGPGECQSCSDEQGDKALKEVADLLKKTFRASDIIARLGGDEFAVFASGIGRNYADEILHRLEENLEVFNSKKGVPYSISLSIGTAAQNTQSPMTIDKLIFLADQQMYIQKKQKDEPE